MVAQQYNKFLKENKLRHKYLSVSKVVYEYRDLTINIDTYTNKYNSSENRENVTLFFENLILYRVTNESYLLQTWKDWPKDTNKDGVVEVIYLVENSELLKSFHKETYGIYEDDGVQHYAIYTMEDCIDVLTRIPPVFR